MNILMAYFSRTGCTETLAQEISRQLQIRGHSIEYEVIKASMSYSWIREVARDWPRYPSIAASIVSPTWREHHLRTYNQVEEDIQPLTYPNVKNFDCICVGGPKWAQISYPVARYLQIVRGIRNKKVGTFATFGGPPLKTFEVELIEKPLANLINRLGGHVVAHVGISSGYHEASIMPLFRLASRIRFRKPIKEFMMGSEYANTGIAGFCANLEKEVN